MLDYVSGTDILVPVILQSPAGVPTAGIAAAGVTLSIRKANNSGADVSVSSSQWTELTGAAYINQGYYNLVISSSYTDVTGVFQYCAYVSGSNPYFGVIKIVSGDSTAIMNRLGVPNYGTIVADIANVGVTAGSGGFTNADRDALYTAKTQSLLLPADPASQSGTIAYITQSFWTADRSTLGAIKLKTDILPADPLGTTTLNSALTQTYTTIDNYTAAQFTTIKGATWSSTSTLQAIAASTTYSYAYGALQSITASISGYVTQSRDYLAGTGFIPGTDDLHGLSVQIQGITPSSGGGGFSVTDRAMLESAYSSTLPLPGDPLSTAYFTASLTATWARIMGSGSFGAGTGTNVWQVAQDTSAIRNKTVYIQSTNQVATTLDVTNARDYLAGAGFVAASDTLHVISNQIQSQSFSASFSAADRTMLSQTYHNTDLIYNTDLAIKSKTDNLPASPADQTIIDSQFLIISGGLAASGGFSTDDRNRIIYVSSTLSPNAYGSIALDIAHLQNDITSDGVQLTNIWGKVTNLPADPCSETALTNIAGIPANASQPSLTAKISATYLAAVNGSSSILTRLGTPAGASVSADIAVVNANAASAASNASSANNSAINAAAQATTAATNASAAGTQATNAYNESVLVYNRLGVPMSGTVSADISATYKAALSGGSSFSGSITASVDLSPITRLLGTPITTVSKDIYEVAKMVNKLPKK